MKSKPLDALTPRDVSVVIPTFNEQSEILESMLSAQQAGATEIIVSDGGSDDGTVKIAKELGAVVIHCDRGRGNQLAKGGAIATGQVLLFLHADNRLGPDGLAQLVDAYQQTQDPHSLWGGFHQRIRSTSAIYRPLEWGNAMRIRIRGMPFGDQAFFVSRELYDQVGGFRALPLMEDVDLARRLRRICWPIILPGPVSVDARRWQKHGVVRQTLRNWSIQIAHAIGVSEQRLHRWYR